MAAADSAPVWRLYYGTTGYAVVKAESSESALMKLPHRKRSKVTKIERF